MNIPVDPIEYIGGQQIGRGARNSPVKQFIAELAKVTKEIRRAGEDTGRLMTVFKVKLESTKKIAAADIVVGVGAVDAVAGPLAVVKTVDPNITHPLRQTEIIEQIENLQGQRFTSYVFQAIAWKHNLKSNPTFCWRAKEGVLTRYSQDTVAYIKRLTQADIEAAMKDYREYSRARSSGRRRS
jgi:EC042_2821-like Restriction Endonuclease-like domain